MNYSKELLYHMVCEKCSNWWSYPSTTVADFQNKTWYCPHCSREHLPPHINKNNPVEKEDFLETIRCSL